MRTGNGTTFIGIAGTVLALDRATGEEVWRTELKGSDTVNLSLDAGNLLASTHGEVFCLNPATGEIRWNNGLRGLGYGLVTFAGPSTAIVAEDQDQRRRAD